MKKNIITIAITGFAFTLTGVYGDEKGKGRDHPDAEAIFKAIDSDGDGSVTLKELAESKRFKDASKREVGEAFKEKDINGDGSISEREFERTFGPSWDRHGKGHKGKGKGKGEKGKEK